MWSRVSIRASIDLVRIPRLAAPLGPLLARTAFPCLINKGWAFESKRVVRKLILIKYMQELVRTRLLPMHAPPTSETLRVKELYLFAMEK